MNFWNWISENYEHTGDRFGYSKRIFVGIVIFIIIPVIIYTIVAWDPVIGTDEDGELVKFGIYMIIALYWFALYIDYKRYEAKKRLSTLLDKLFTQNDDQFQNLIELVQNKREVIKKDSTNDYRNEGEERLKWFGIN